MYGKATNNVKIVREFELESKQWWYSDILRLKSKDFEKRKKIVQSIVDTFTEKIWKDFFNVKAFDKEYKLEKSSTATFFKYPKFFELIERKGKKYSIKNFLIQNILLIKGKEANDFNKCGLENLYSKCKIKFKN